MTFNMLPSFTILYKLSTLIITLISYKERNGYLCWFLSVFLNNIFKSHAIWQ